jgi:hypothetical protein
MEFSKALTSQKDNNWSSYQTENIHSDQEDLGSLLNRQKNKFFKGTGIGMGAANAQA